MLARPAPAPFDSPRHLFEPAWGGRRALAFLEAAVEAAEGGGWLTADGRPSARIVDAEGRDILERLPELQALSLRLDARSAVLDGELVAVDAGGRSDATLLRGRLAPGGGRGHAPAAIAFLAFDLLYIDGRPVLAQPLVRRRELLRQALRPGPEVLIVPAIEADGLALHAAVAAQGLAGVRARVRSSPYLPGVRSVLWRSIRATADAAASPAEGPGDATTPVGPVLGVIARLPLDDAIVEGPLPR